MPTINKYQCFKFIKMEENNSKTEKYNTHSVRYMYTKEECYQESLNYDSAQINLHKVI